MITGRMPTINMLIGITRKDSISPSLAKDNIYGKKTQTKRPNNIETPLLKGV